MKAFIHFNLLFSQIWFCLIIKNVKGLNINLVDTLFEASENLEDWLNKINYQFRILNHLSATIAWDLSIEPTEQKTSDGTNLSIVKTQWRNVMCKEGEWINKSHFMQTGDQRDMLHTISKICTGPKFTIGQIRDLNNALGMMYKLNTETAVCLPKSLNLCTELASIWSNTYVQPPEGDLVLLPLDSGEFPRENCFIEDASTFNCLKNEPHLEEVLSGDFSPLGSLDCVLPRNLIFRWAWLSFRQAVGPEVGKFFSEATILLNDGAKMGGYSNIGEYWREEYEMPNFNKFIDTLLLEIKPLYFALHAVIRHVLVQKYPDVPYFRKDGYVPADLCGGWAENWEFLLPDILPFSDVNLDDKMMATKWTPKDMVTRAEDFYTSLGLPEMTSEFWTKSMITRSSDGDNMCHGTAANMFSENDFRMIVCSETRLYDFYVIVHEMGHIQYYMAYENQRPLFQDGHSAIHEAIGDVIWMAMMSPQHLNRLGLIEDQFLVSFNEQKAFDIEYLCMIFCDPNPQSKPKLDRLQLNSSSNTLDISLLLRMALSHVPKHIFAYIIDAVRWEFFAEQNKINDELWKLMNKHMGIKPPGPDGASREGFDIGTKFHVADNTPMARYFLAGMLQAQIFRGLCEVTLYGKVTGEQSLPMPLHRCDIYGSKAAGKILKKAMSLGSSVHWSEVLDILTGKKSITADAYLEYYKPIQSWLEEIILAFNITYGWLNPKYRN